MRVVKNEIVFSGEDGKPITTSLVIADIFGKEPEFWLMNQSTTGYLNELSKVRNLTLADLVQVTKGGNNPGTWMHEDVALKIIRFLIGYLRNCCTFAMSNIFKGRRLSAYSRHFLCLYIIATKILRLLPPCGEVNALPTAFEVCSTTGKDSRFSVYNAKNVE